MRLSLVRGEASVETVRRGKEAMYSTYSKKGRGDVKPGVEKGVEVADRCDTLDQLAIRWQVEIPTSYIPRSIGRLLLSAPRFI